LYQQLDQEFEDEDAKSETDDASKTTEDEEPFDPDEERDDFVESGYGKRTSHHRPGYRSYLN